MKKRLFLIPVILLILTLCSCSVNLNPENINFNRSFSFTANMEYNGMKSTAEFTRKNIESWEGTLTEPYALQGVKIDYTPDELIISYSGFSVRYNETSSEDINIMAYIMIDALESAFCKDGITVTSGKGFIEVSGMSQSGAYVLTLDNAGVLLSLKVADKKFSVEFDNVKAENFKEKIPQISHENSDEAEVAPSDEMYIY